ncbi:MAG: exodeoxyribonuclease VII small subunit [Saprospiraceae bacterium]|nr:exodeoxyribonuclease VII small subunit [Saprospiraceae bacterium]
MDSLPEKYEDALSDLNKIVNLVDGQGTSLDDLLSHVQHAQKLIEHCKNKLRGLENDLTKIL